VVVGVALPGALCDRGGHTGNHRPSTRDFAEFLDSDRGEEFFRGEWGWFAVIVVLAVFNTVLGEELLFRGLLLPRMRGVFGRRRQQMSARRHSSGHGVRLRRVTPGGPWPEGYGASIKCKKRYGITVD